MQILLNLPRSLNLVGEIFSVMGGEHLEEENIWSAEEKKKGEGKGGKYLEKENI